MKEAAIRKFGEAIMRLESIEEINTLIIPIIEKEYKRPGVLKDTSKHYRTGAFYARWLCLVVILFSLMMAMAIGTILNPFFRNPLVKPTPIQAPCAHMMIYNDHGQITTLTSTQCDR